MGNRHSEPEQPEEHEGGGLIKLVQHQIDVKKAFRDGGLQALNSVDAKKATKNEYAEEVDQNTLRFVLIARATGASKGDKVPDPAEVCKTFKEKSEASVFELPGLPIPFLDQDEDKPMSASAQKIYKGLMHNLSVLPMVEKNPTFFEKPEDVKRTTIQVFGSNSLPSQSVYWHHWDNVNTIRNLAFNGIGAYYISRVTNPAGVAVPINAKYELNLAKWYDFDVRRVDDSETEPEGYLEQGLKHFVDDITGKGPKPDSPASPTNPEMFHRYGGILYFDEHKAPLGIWWPEKGSFVAIHDPDFHAAWFVLRSTLLTVATVQHHLISLHWIIANSGTVASNRFLSPNHKIRRLLKPHTFGTASVNFASTAMLAPVRGLAYRGFGFNQKGFTEVIEYSLADFKFESFEEHATRANLDDADRESIAFYHDGIAFWKVIEEYVTNYIKISYATDAEITADRELNDFWCKGYHEYFGNHHTGPRFDVGELNRANLIKLLTNHIFWVTGGHEFIGSIIEYLSDNGALPPKVYRPRADAKETVAHQYETDVQSFLQGLILISLTSGNMPKMIDNWSYMWDAATFPKDEDLTAIQANFSTYQNKLENLRETVRLHNLKRHQPVNVFAEHLESSVSV